MKNGAFVVCAIAVGVLENIDAVVLRAFIAFRPMMRVILLNENAPVRCYGDAGWSYDVRVLGEEGDFGDIRMMKGKVFGDDRESGGRQQRQRQGNRELHEEEKTLIIETLNATAIATFRRVYPR